MNWASRIWKYFLALAACFSVVGFVVTSVALIYGEEWFSSNKHLVFAHSFYWVIVIFLFYLLSEKPQTRGLHLPNVKLVKDDGRLLAENADWLSIGTICAIYLLEGDFEILQCEGIVLNIQENGLVQIETANYDAESYVENLQKNKEAILIKPGVKR